MEKRETGNDQPHKQIDMHYLNLNLRIIHLPIKF